MSSEVLCKNINNFWNHTNLNLLDSTTPFSIPASCPHSLLPSFVFNWTASDICFSGASRFRALLFEQQKPVAAAQWYSFQSLSLSFFMQIYREKISCLYIFSFSFSCHFFCSTWAPSSSPLFQPAPAAEWNETPEKPSYISIPWIKKRDNKKTVWH